MPKAYYPSDMVDEFSNSMTMRQDWFDGSCLEYVEKTKGCIDQEEVQLAHSSLIGTVDNNGVKWRILGWNNGRADGMHLACEYNVMHLQSTWQANGATIQEMRPTSGNDHIMKVSPVDEENEHKKLLHEYEMIRFLRHTYRTNWRFLDCFPRLFGQGELTEMHYISVYIHYRFKPAVPRPFFIMEKIEPKLEIVMRAGTAKGIGHYAAAFLTIGCINALRHLHRAGVVHRNVQPSQFAVRLSHNGKLHRKECELANKVAIIGFSFCRRYKELGPEKGKRFLIGTLRYVSPSVMKGEEHTPVDDLISCMYMLHEMLTNTNLPWLPKDVTEAKSFKVSHEKIIKEKEMLEQKKDISIVADKKTQIVFEGWKGVFDEIRKGNGFDRPIDYEAVITKIFKGVTCCQDMAKDIGVFGYQQPMVSCLRHGCEMKDGKMAAPKCVEPEDMVAAADLLFPAARKDKDKPK